MCTLCGLCCRHTANLEAITHIVDHRHVRKQGIALKHHADIALGWAQLRDVLAIYQNLTTADRFQSCDHAQGGGLATAGGTQQSGERALGHHKIDAFNHQGSLAFTITLGHLTKLDACK